jgi:hypothetical protein
MDEEDRLFEGDTEVDGLIDAVGDARKGACQVGEVGACGLRVYFQDEEFDLARSGFVVSCDNGSCPDPENVVRAGAEIVKRIKLATDVSREAIMRALTTGE